MKNRLNYVYWKVRVILFISELFEKSCQVMGSHGYSCHVHGIPWTKRGLHSHAQLIWKYFIEIKNIFKIISNSRHKFLLQMKINKNDLQENQYKIYSFLFLFHNIIFIF
jgi:hypothetical protein